MREVDGWAEAVDYIDEDDVKRWTADKKLDAQRSKSALAFAVKSDTMRKHLFADNYFLRAHAETLEDKAPKPNVIEADNPGTSATAARPIVFCYTLTLSINMNMSYYLLSISVLSDATLWPYGRWRLSKSVVLTLLFCVLDPF